MSWSCFVLSAVNPLSLFVTCGFFFQQHTQLMEACPLLNWKILLPTPTTACTSEPTQPAWRHLWRHSRSLCTLCFNHQRQKVNGYLNTRQRSDGIIKYKKKSLTPRGNHLVQLREIHHFSSLKKQNKKLSGTLCEQFCYFLETQSALTTTIAHGWCCGVDTIVCILVCLFRTDQWRNWWHCWWGAVFADFIWSLALLLLQVWPLSFLLLLLFLHVGFLCFTACLFPYHTLCGSHSVFATACVCRCFHAPTHPIAWWNFVCAAIFLQMHLNV